MGISRTNFFLYEIPSSLQSLRKGFFNKKVNFSTFSCLSQAAGISLFSTKLFWRYMRPRFLCCVKRKEQALNRSGFSNNMVLFVVFRHALQMSTHLESLVRHPSLGPGDSDKVFHMDRSCFCEIACLRKFTLSTTLCTVQVIDCL